uniref:Uncharacterized protein n=1 Tax=Eucampia antarctica TaxID=49252 RepID=A0A7S2RHG3_9STRA|mmetsp:Transcript_22266/g.21407  ORF Transcript_22266/g.21407 Transcript_22266/m.21407 type:complete len:204 (+) Transcript_22266:54-665(+)
MTAMIAMEIIIIFVVILLQVAGNNNIVTAFLIGNSILRHDYNCCKSSTPSPLLAKNNDNFGELSMSKKLPKLNVDLLEAASCVLSWENNGLFPHSKEEWEEGQVWKETRVELVELWILPRDMSNGSWENYALAANKGELQLLLKAPQLLRLPTQQVVTSAKTILKTLRLPPALLRQEPILLSIPSLLLEQASNNSHLNFDIIC